MNAPEYPKFSIWLFNLSGIVTSVWALNRCIKYNETKQKLDNIEKQGGV
jgi:hypothetical protein